nr:CoA transferase [Streptomyces albus]
MADERSVQAACGLMEVHGRAAGRPTPLAVDYAATVAGVLAAQGVCAVLLGRLAGGDPARVRTSVSRAALFSVTQYLAAATATGDGTEQECGRKRRSAEHGGHRAFVTADGVAFELEALDAERWLGFWQRLGASRTALRDGWTPFQQRFATATCPLPQELHRLVGGLPYATISAAAARSGADVLPVRQDPAPGETPRPWTLGPVGGGTAGPGHGTAWAGPGGKHAGGGATWAKGGITRAGDGIARAGGGPAGAGPLPLAGVRVVESTRRVQGPLAGHVLRLLGAEVVRVEPPGGDPMRGMPPLAGACSARFRALNDGKTVVEADITTAAGRRTVRELTGDADVFLHNWAPGKAARFRLDAEDLCAGRPRLVHAWASGWGDLLGPAPPVGTDFLVQAHSGLAAAVRPAHETPVPSLMTLTDVLGGLVCAQAVLAALLVRARTGRAVRVDSSLLSAASVVPRPRTRAHWGPWDRPLATADGHLWLADAARRLPDRVADVIGADAATCADALATRMSEATTAEWTARFARAGLTAVPVCTDLARLATDPRFEAAVERGGADPGAAPGTADRNPAGPGTVNPERPGPSTAASSTAAPGAAAPGAAERGSGSPGSNGYVRPVTPWEFL